MRRIAKQRIAAPAALALVGLAMAAPAVAGGYHKHKQYVQLVPAAAPVAQAPVAYTQVAQAPVAYTQVAQAPVAYTQVAQAPVAYTQVAQAPVGYATTQAYGVGLSPSASGSVAIPQAILDDLNLTATQGAAMLSDLRVFYLTSSATSQYDKITDVRDEAVRMLNLDEDGDSTKSKSINSLVDLAINSSGLAPAGLNQTGYPPTYGQGAQVMTYQYVQQPAAPAPVAAAPAIPAGYTFVPLVPKHSLFHKNVYRVP